MPQAGAPYISSWHQTESFTETSLWWEQPFLRIYIKTNLTYRIRIFNCCTLQFAINTAHTIHILTVEREMHKDSMNPSVQIGIHQSLLLSTCLLNPNLSHCHIPITATVTKNLTHWLIIRGHITQWLLPLSGHFCDQFRRSLPKDDPDGKALFLGEGD